MAQEWILYQINKKN